MIFSSTTMDYSILNLIPEIFLTVAIFIQLIWNLIFFKNKSDTNYFEVNSIYFIQTFLILVFTLVLLNVNNLESTKLLLIINTSTTSNLKSFLILFSILALGPIAQGLILQKLPVLEFYTLYLFSILSSILLISAGDFLVIYLLIEMQSLCFYVLAVYRKDSVFSIESGLKYFIFNSIISCVLVFSLSVLYGSLGTLNLHNINLLMYSFPFDPAFDFINYSVVFSLLLVIIVLLFKLGVVPFHFWVPDVYEGAPLSSTIVFSFLPKIVLFDLLVKISQIFGDAFKEVQVILIFTGVLSIIVGSLFAIRENKVKRFLIYSSISMMGYPILILSMNSYSSLHNIYAFILLYTLSSILVWTAYVLFYQHFEKSVSVGSLDPFSITDFSNLYNLDKVWAFMFCFVFFIFSGIPPFSIFLSKLIVLSTLLLNQQYAIAIIISFASLISTFYYIVFIKAIFFDRADFKNTLSYSSPRKTLLYFYNCIVSVICIFFLVNTVFFLDLLLTLSEYFTLHNLF
jgi:NADH-quinone oxidoreductase subunit N